MTTAHYTAILEQNQDISSLLAQNILDQDDDQERVYCVYMHTSPSGKSYVGQTNDYNRRSRHHNTKNGCPAFKAAIDKYGWDKFTHVVMADTLTLAEANFLEKHFIFSLNTLSPAGYNLKTGGLNSLHTEATKQKISDSNQGKYFSEEHKQNMRDNHADVSGEKNPCFGRVLSEDHLKKLRDANVGRAQTEEHKQKLSASRKGKKRSEETKQKMRDANAGKSLSEATKQKISDSKKGKPLTTEHKQKLSAIRKGKKLSEETKQKMRDANSGEKSCNWGKFGADAPKSKMYAVTFPSGHVEIIRGLVQFCAEYGLTRGSMTTVAKGKFKQHKGFKCEYYDPEQPELI